MTNHPASTYREFSVHGAGPLRLVAMLYDRAITDLHRAIKAVEAKDVPQRAKHLNHFLDIVGELEGSLNLESGGEVAEILKTFYAFARARVLEAGFKNSKEILDELILHFSSLRDAWQQVENSPNAGAQGPPSAPLTERHPLQSQPMTPQDARPSSRWSA